MSVKVDYYYASEIYHTFFEYVQHSAKGYRTSCWFITYNHYPKNFTTLTDWKTYVYSGQVLDQWAPKNVGSAVTISYTIASAGISLGARPSLSVEYSAAESVTIPAIPYFE